MYKIYNLLCVSFSKRKSVLVLLKVAGKPFTTIVYR